MLGSAVRRLSDSVVSFTKLVILWVTLAITWLVCWIVFRVLNQTIVTGPGVTQPGERLLIVSNHQSLIDSFLVGLVIYYPELLWQPRRAPYHLADARNFMTHPVLRFVYAVLRVIPVQRAADGSRRDGDAFRRAVKVLKQGGMLHVFLEGTRSQNDELLSPREQVGTMALLSGATVRPVFITGLHAVHPYRKKPGDGEATWWRRCFGVQTEWLLDVRVGHTVHVVVGDDLSPSEQACLAGEGDLRTRSERLAVALMDRLKCLKETYEKLQRAQAA